MTMTFLVFFLLSMTSGKREELAFFDVVIRLLRFGTERSGGREPGFCVDDCVGAWVFAWMIAWVAWVFAWVAWVVSSTQCLMLRRGWILRASRDVQRQLAKEKLFFNRV